MTLITFDLVRNTNHLDRREVDASEWGPTREDGSRQPLSILVRALTAREKDLYEESLVEMKNNKRKVKLVDSRARLAILCCINEDGTSFFKSRDLDWLTGKPAIVFDRIAKACEEMNGIAEEDEEELEKNSD